MLPGYSISNNVECIGWSVILEDLSLIMYKMCYISIGATYLWTKCLQGNENCTNDQDIITISILKMIDKTVICSNRVFAWPLNIWIFIVVFYHKVWKIIMNIHYIIFNPQSFFKSIYKNLSEIITHFYFHKYPYK